MSGKEDLRVQRTKERLGDAMFELVRELPFTEITVQAVLDRAGVSRSTFYVHYKDKADLYASDLDEFLGRMASTLVRTNETSDRIAPVAEFLSHLADVRALYGTGNLAKSMPFSRSRKITSPERF